MKPRITWAQAAPFFWCDDPFCSNGSRLDPFESNGVEVLGRSRQGAQSGGGEGEEETSSHQRVLARPTKGSADFCLIYDQIIDFCIIYDEIMDSYFICEEIVF